jgi:hypothetical protein
MTIHTVKRPAAYQYSSSVHSVNYPFFFLFLLWVCIYGPNTTMIYEVNMHRSPVEARKLCKGGLGRTSTRYS